MKEDKEEKDSDSKIEYGTKNYSERSWGEQIIDVVSPKLVKDSVWDHHQTCTAAMTESLVRPNSSLFLFRAILSNQGRFVLNLAKSKSKRLMIFPVAMFKLAQMVKLYFVPSAKNHSRSALIIETTLIMTLLWRSSTSAQLSVYKCIRCDTVTLHL